MDVFRLLSLFLSLSPYVTLISLSFSPVFLSLTSPYHSLLSLSLSSISLSSPLSLSLCIYLISFLLLVITPIQSQPCTLSTVIISLHGCPVGGLLKTLQDTATKILCPSKNPGDSLWGTSYCWAQTQIKPCTCEPRNEWRIGSLLHWPQVNDDIICALSVSLWTEPQPSTMEAIQFSSLLNLFFTSQTLRTRS